MFVDRDGDGQADRGAVSASIRAVDGTVQPAATQVTTVTPGTDGSVTVTVRDGGDGAVVPVVYGGDAASTGLDVTDGPVPLDQVTTAAERYVVGPTISYQAPPLMAVSSEFGGALVGLHLQPDQFLVAYADAPTRLAYDDGDTVVLDGTTLPGLAEVEVEVGRLLREGRDLTLTVPSYDPESKTPETFDIRSTP